MPAPSLLTPRALNGNGHSNGSMNGNGHARAPMDVEQIFGQNTFGLAEM